MIYLIEYNGTLDLAEDVLNVPSTVYGRNYYTKEVITRSGEYVLYSNVKILDRLPVESMREAIDKYPEVCI